MRVLVVEDEPLLAGAIRDGLRLEAIAADTAGDGDTALELLAVNTYDIAVLDRDVPGPSGDEIARQIVASGSGMPILMLTAADRIDDKVSGFELGADDYLTKPFDLEELLARMRALVRRGDQPQASRIELGDLKIDLLSRRVWRGERQVDLSSRQFALLEYFVRHSGQVLSRQQILSAVWDYAFDPGSNVVDVYVSYLRNKLDRRGEPSLIATVRGAGYRFEPPAQG
jgi:DNA-binding response OmpR family regulator